MSYRSIGQAPTNVRRTTQGIPCEGSSRWFPTGTVKVEGTDVVAAVKAAGFSITTEDLNTELLDQELSTDALQSITGGKSYNYHCTVRTKDGATKEDCNFPNHNH